MKLENVTPTLFALVSCKVFLSYLSHATTRLSHATTRLPRSDDDQRGRRGAGDAKAQQVHP